jgi:uncharacterized damage-inducible protein DinB
MKTHIERMLRAMSWADQRTIAAVGDCPAAHAEALPLLSHVLAAEQVWLARLQQHEASHPVWPQLTVPQCATLAAENAAGYAALLEDLAEDDLTIGIRYKNTKGDEFTTTRIDILTHVVIHGAYHRGQIAKVLGRSGVQPASTDYIMFTRLDESAGA